MFSGLGHIGLDVRGSWFEPVNPDEAGINATLSHAYDFDTGMVLEPLLSSGEYPVWVQQRVGVLPKFSLQEKNNLKGR